MDLLQPKFFPSVFQIEHHGASLELSGLASMAGITSINVPGNLTDLWRRLVDQLITVKFDGMEINAMLPWWLSFDV